MSAKMSMLGYFLSADAQQRLLKETFGKREERTMPGTLVQAALNGSFEGVVTLPNSVWNGVNQIGGERLEATRAKVSEMRLDFHLNR
jgi:hypothetical protein